MASNLDRLATTLNRFLFFIFEEKNCTSHFNAFCLIMRGIQALDGVPLKRYSEAFSNPNIWIMLMVIFPPHCTSLELFWLSKLISSSDWRRRKKTTTIQRILASYDYSHRFVGLNIITKKNQPNAEAFLSAIFSDTKEKDIPDDCQEIKNLNGVYVIPRPMNSVRTGLRNLGITYQPKSSKLLLPLPKPRSSRELVRSCLNTLHQEYLLSVKVYKMLQVAKKSLTTFHSFLIPNVPLCFAKCVPLKYLDVFLDKTLLIRCKQCMSKNSNFSESKKSGFVVDRRREELLCNTCGSKNVDYLPLIDIRFIDEKRRNFVCDFYVIASNLFPFQDLLSSQLKKIPVFSPCFNSRLCYNIINHKKRDAPVDFYSQTFFLQQKCCNCARENTCLDELTKKPKSDIQKIKIFDFLCPGCIIAVACNCLECIKQDHLHVLKQNLFRTLNLYRDCII